MKSLFFISLIFLFPACKKETTSAPPTPSYRIASVTRTGASVDMNYRLTYDATGRISQIVSDGPGGFTKTFSYKGDTIYIKGDVPIAENSYLIAVSLNSFNLMSTRKVTIQQSVSNATYNYDGTGKILSLNTQHGSYIYPAISYTVTNGDITNSTSQGMPLSNPCLQKFS